MHSDSQLDPLRVDLQSLDRSHNLAAAEELLKNSNLAQQLAPELLQLLATADEALREVCVGAIENCKSLDAGVAQRLAPFLKGDELQAVWAAKLLGRIGADAAFAVSDLAKLLVDSTSLPAREEAAWALGQIGGAAVGAAPALEAAAKESSPRLARYAKEAIAKIGGV